MSHSTTSSDFAQNAAVTVSMLGTTEVPHQIVNGDSGASQEPPPRLEAGTGPTIEVPMILVESPGGSRWWFPGAMSIEDADEVVAQAVREGIYTANKVMVPVILPSAESISDTLSDFACEPIAVEMNETLDDPFAESFEQFVRDRPGAIA